MKKKMILILIVFSCFAGNFAANSSADADVRTNRFSLKAFKFDDRCTVADPTGTPLNLRDLPRGKVIGKLKNGTVVYKTSDMYDTEYRNWSEIKLSRRGRTKGWVVTEFLDCSQS